MKRIMLLSVFMFCFACNVDANDRELFDKIIKDAITTLIMQKYSHIEVGNRISLDVNSVFPQPSAKIKLNQKGKCIADWKTTKTICY